MIARFAEGVTPGEDIEGSFYKWADALAAIEDPAVKAQFAMDRFGKAGLDMLKIAGDGSQAIKDLASTFLTFSETDIEAIKEANAQLDRFMNQSTVYLGKVIGFAAWYVKLAGQGFENLRLGGSKNPLEWARQMARGDEDEKFYAGRASTKSKRASAKAAEVMAAKDALAKWDAMKADDAFKNASPSEKLDVLYGRYVQATRAADKAKTPEAWLKGMQNAKAIEAQMSGIAAGIKPGNADYGAAAGYIRTDSAMTDKQLLEVNRRSAESLEELNRKLNPED